MGRPLKITKAQAVVTITNTNVNGTVTVTQNLNSTQIGVAVGMPFVVATSVGGLVANTTYYVLSIPTNTTFTVSSTHPTVRPQVRPTLSTTSLQSVSMSVAVVDAWNNNPNDGAGFPATNANTYSVVGGNTAIIGKQVLANIAIGVLGNGIIYANAASNSVVGFGSDFANVATGSILFSTTPSGVNSLLGTVSATKGNLLVAVANTTATGNIIGTSGNAQLLTVNTPVAFSGTFGNLTAGTTYWVQSIINAAAFTVSTTLFGSLNNIQQPLTSNASVTGNAFQNRAVLGAVSSNNAVGTSYVQALPEAGFIVRQKGKSKYLVTGTVTGLTNHCFLANLANTALTPNTMRVIATYANAATQAVQYISDHNNGLFTADSGTVATGNIVLDGQPGNIYGYVNTAPVTATFNSAADANAANGQPYPIVVIASA
jgi:hypothetical protein